jgi:hypothetical protein
MLRRVGADVYFIRCGWQILGWNLRELVVQSAVPYVVSVAGCLHVKYLQTEEALAVSWKFGVRTLT